MSESEVLDPEDEWQRVVFCDARQADERGALICDYLQGHGGERHAERWVATWLRDGSDVRWYVGDSRRTGRPVYRTAAADQKPAGQGDEAAEKSSPTLAEVSR